MEQNFSPEDINVFQKRNITLEKIASHFYFFQNGIPKINLNRPAKINDGILILSKNRAHEYANVFDGQKHKYKLLKFVPASGAASRMFKFLSAFLNDFKIEQESISEYINRNNDKNLALFLDNLSKFPFYNDVLKATQTLPINDKQHNLDAANYVFVKTMLSEKQFDFANKPKAILPFHCADTIIFTAIDEHLKECLAYGASNGKANLHFTVSHEHQPEFEAIVSKFKSDNNSAVEINVTYSYQCQSTDVLAYNLDATPFRKPCGNLVFRPGGHGALIENLNQLDADLIFIKNIDNVIQSQLDTQTLYKKALAGILIENQNIVFQCISILKNGMVSDNDFDEIVSFLSSKLSIKVVDNLALFSVNDKIDYLLNVLNRPIRVCGMVKNEGEAGGGPFWISDSLGGLSLQIIEAVQVDSVNPLQNEILINATHFNPVDVVCGIKNSDGFKFNLHDFVDNSTGFIVEKAKNGVSYRALELPGLWNGAMAKWLTIFVEVPIFTFNPVKTVNDLLKPAHQFVK